MNTLKINIDKFLIALISFESIGWIIGSVAQTTPIIYLFAVLAFPLYAFKVKFTPILTLLSIFFGYSVIITLVYFFREVSLQDSHIVSNRISAALRQGISLLLGIMLFVVLRSVIKRLGKEKVLRYCILSIIPIALFVVIELPYYINYSEYRIKSYFSEPSHLADFLVQMFLGAVFVYSKLNNKVLSNRVLFFLILIALSIMVCTSSGTGFIKLFLFIIGILIFEKSKLLRLGIIIITLMLLVAGVYYFINNENNYLVKMVVASSGESADKTASYVDRYYSFIAPISSIFKSNVAVGYGLGGDNIYYSSFYPQELIEIVQSVKLQEFGIVSFWGKILVFTGLPGLLLWGMIIYQLKIAVRKNTLIRNVFPVLFSIYIANFLGSGAFLFVQHWFWMAFIDTENISDKEV